MNIRKIVIPGKSKLEFLKTLNQFGLNHFSIFPDLEGLSKEINWKVQQKI